MVLARLKNLVGGGGSSNYAYVTARVRASKTSLLPTDTYPKLLARDVHEIARTLQEGRYKDDIDALAGKHAGARLIELATRRHLGREYARVLSWCKGEVHMMVSEYLERYSIYNAKAALRGVAARASADQIHETVVPAGMIPDSVFEAAIHASSIEDAADALSKTHQCAVLASVKSRGLPAMENALDRHYYAHLLAAVPPSDRAKRAFLDFLRREIDLVNIKAALRLNGSESAEFDPVPGGLEINAQIVRRLTTAPAAEVPGILDATGYGPAVKDALTAWVSSGDLNPVVTALDKHHLATAQEFSHLYPLSILPVVDYVLRKRVEVDNLRMIAVGKASGLDDDTIRAMVMA